MSQPPETSKLPIDQWDPALQAIARCLEALNACQKVYERDHWTHGNSTKLYVALIASVEKCLCDEYKNKSWGAAEGLAELSLGNGYIRRDRAIGYLYAAAEAGYVNAQLELARAADRHELPSPVWWGANVCRDRFSEERNDEFNHHESRRWWEAAAENGSADAEYAMACRWIESDNPDHFADGVKWLRRAAYNQTPAAGAQYDLAYLMELERIDPESPRERWRLYEAAARSGVAESMLAAGHCLEYGIGVEHDIEAAIAWYVKAANAGYDEGYLLAGLLSDQDCHLEAAAKAGHVEAMMIVAKRKLDEGWGPYGLDSFLAGVDYYRAAADSGNLEAARAVAEIYETGKWIDCAPEDWEGVSVFSREHHESERLESALYWYERAQELGCQWAAENIARIKKMLGGDEDSEQESG